MTEVPHKKYLNDYFRGIWPGSNARGELYNDDPKLGDARLCGTTASLLGLEPALESGEEEWVSHVVGAIESLHAFLLTQSGIPVLYSGDELALTNAGPITMTHSRRTTPTSIGATSTGRRRRIATTRTPRRGGSTKSCGPSSASALTTKSSTPTRTSGPWSRTTTTSSGSGGSTERKSCWRSSTSTRTRRPPGCRRARPMWTSSPATK